MIDQVVLKMSLINVAGHEPSRRTYVAPALYYLAPPHTSLVEAWINVFVALHTFAGLPRTQDWKFTLMNCPLTFGLLLSSRGF